jgi:competence protein ComEC
MLTVSLAAQLITFPLSILYFNQFPNFFWLSNYFVIPATTFIIWLTFGFFALSWLPVIPDILAQLIQFTMHLMLGLLKWISKLPHAVSEGIVFSPTQTWIIYGFLAAFVIYGFSKKRAWLFSGLVLVIFFQVSSLLTKAELFNQKAVCVYNSRQPLIHFINSRSNYVLLNRADSISEQEMNIIKNVQKHLRLEEPKLINLKSVNDFDIKDLDISNKSIRFLNCWIDLSKQLKFHIRSFDLEKFRSDNPELVMKKMIKEPQSDDHSDSSGKQVFSIDFTAKYKEPLFLSLN